MLSVSDIFTSRDKVFWYKKRVVQGFLLLLLKLVILAHIEMEVKLVYGMAPMVVYLIQRGLQYRKLDQQHQCIVMREYAMIYIEVLCIL